MYNKATIILLAFTLGACAGPEMTGRTVANELLRKDTIQLLTPYAQARLDCNRIDSIRSNPVSASPDGVVVESWQVSGCGNQASFSVRFTPSPSGGVDINISLDQ